VNFLIDENLPSSLKAIFQELGFEVSHVRDTEELRGQPDEVIFKHAVSTQSIVVTRDVNFANQVRFELHKMPGIIILRFPNDVTMEALRDNLKDTISSFTPATWHNIVVIEPDSIRLRPLS
jgi:predicted nuclease of predicted toxin-antitoxin system